MKTLLTTAAIAAAMMTGAAHAATVYATSATIVNDGPRGTANDRGNIANALGDTTGDFFELGFGATVDFTFGTLFSGPVNLLEVTFGNVANHPESVNIFAGLGGVFTQVLTLANMDAQGTGISFDLAGVYDTLRLTDTSPMLDITGGFDVDTVSVQSVVAPVPLPAAGLLLVGALGGLGALKRRRKTA